MNENKLKALIKKNMLFIFSLPIVLNAGFNLLQNIDSEFFDQISYAKVCSFILGSIFFIYLSDILNNLFNIGGRSLALVLFLTSFFTFDAIFLFIGKTFSFQSIVIFISFVWMVLIFFKTKSFLYILKIFSIFLIYRIFNNIFLTDILDNSTYQELNTDVPVQWFDIARMIYENNYYFALQNNLIEGQGLLPSYIQALLVEIGFSVEIFQFVQVNSYLFLTFSLLLVADLKITNKNKLILSVLFMSLILNNNWLEYLLINSLMLEGIVSFLICVYLINYERMLKKSESVSLIFFITFGGMALTKNFVSLICISLIVFSIFLIRKNVYIIGSFLIYVLNLFYQKIYFTEVQNFAYTSEIDFRDLILDFIYLRDLDFTNIVNIINQFYIDKPTSYLVVGFIIFNFINLYKYGTNLRTENFVFFFVVLNYILVNLLYVSYWRNVEYESSYRYIINCFHLIFISLSIQLSKLEKV